MKRRTIWLLALPLQPIDAFLPNWLFQSWRWLRTSGFVDWALPDFKWGFFDTYVF
jgi:hypothetical protein